VRGEKSTTNPINAKIKDVTTECLISCKKSALPAFRNCIFDDENFFGKNV
jgi:hypothetical protein